ncbi:group II truncated hemoglobin [Marinomonas algicola]|uniref:group II truncated hemoglobin n=1 Tax=Marinomonas algicola TaxID=2773454 RepID=UPI00174B9ED4|nr:group II truncated hemoglobin [Marinomonas algicola]
MTIDKPDNIDYGKGDSTLRAVGGHKGLHQLVEDFYLTMSTQSEFKKLRDMHPTDLKLSIDKLYCFLSGWMGGERLYSQKYGSISIPQAHSHIDVGYEDKKMWLDCMAIALEKQAYPKELIRYLLIQLEIPAERIRQVSAARQSIQKKT